MTSKPRRRRRTPRRCAAQHQRAERGLEGRLDVDRLALRPRAGQERLLERGQRLVRGRRGVAGTGQLVEVDQPGGAEPLLEPQVEPGAPAGQRCRRRGQGAAQPPGQRHRVAAQRDQRGHRQVPRQGHLGGAAAGLGPLAEQELGVADPVGDHRVVGRAEPGVAERVRPGARDQRRGGGQGPAPAGRQRVGRPHPDRPLGQRGVGRAVGWRVGPRVDPAAPGPTASTASRTASRRLEGPLGFTPSRHQLPEHSSSRRARVTAT